MRLGILRGGARRSKGVLRVERPQRGVKYGVWKYRVRRSICGLAVFGIGLSRELGRSTWAAAAYNRRV